MEKDNTGRFSSRVADYVKYRPSYPPAVLAYLQEQQGLTAGQHITDIGAGTGISSLLFLDAGYRVTAVEPNREMREEAIGSLGSRPGFAAVDGTAEHTGLPDACTDVIIAGQAFHWFDTTLAAAEFRRILKTGGPVVLLWNERSTNEPFEKAYDLLIRKHGRDYVQVQHRNIDKAHIAAFFDPGKVDLVVFPNSQVFDYAGLEGRLLSSSYMPERRAAGFDAMIDDLKLLYEQYKEHDTITIHYDTKVYTGHFE